MESSVKQRLVEFIRHEGLSVRMFERLANLSNGYIKSLKKSPTTDKMSSIIAAFPMLNQTWLLTGEGNMIKEDKTAMPPVIYHYTTLANAERILATRHFIPGAPTKSNDIAETCYKGKQRYVCFCKSPEMPRMWAQYGGLNRGCCIEIDTDAFIKANEIDDTHAFNIQYVDRTTMQKLTNDKLLQYKLHDWQEENEFRVLVDDERTLSIASSLRDVYIGYMHEGKLKKEVWQDIPKKRMNVLDKILVADIGIISDMQAEMKADNVEIVTQEGIGEMRIIHQPKYTEKRMDEEISVYDIEAAANLQTILTDSQYAIVKDKITIPNAPKCDGAIIVKGDSMYPLIKSGDIVAFKALPLEKASIIFGEMYLVETILDDDYYLAVKYLKASDKGDEYVSLVSYNKEYSPVDIHLSQLHAIALVKFTIHFNTMA